MFILVLQSSWWDRESWLLCLVCPSGVSWLLCGSSSWCHGFVCSLWLWYFLIILTFYLLLLYQLMHVWVLRTGFGLGCATSWSPFMLFWFKAVPVWYASWHHVMLTAKQALCLLASWLVYIVVCLGDQSICFSDFDSRHPSIGVNLRGPQALNIPNCNPQPKNVQQILWLPKHNTIDNSQNASRRQACLAFNIIWCQLKPY